jgi:trimeric autotransporter adhesin
MKAIVLLELTFLCAFCQAQTPVKLFDFPLQADLSPGSAVSKLTNFKTGLAYMQGTELVYSDGTLAGTQVIKSFSAASSMSNFYEQASALYFTTQYDRSVVLWKTDGTAEGTISLDTLSNGGTNYAYIYNFVSLGTTLYFTASADEKGTELWKWNGTECVLVTDLNPGAASGINTSSLVVFNNKLYFSGSNGTTGFELWQSDGTTAGTVLVKDINTTGDSSPYSFTAFNAKLYFAATGASGTELYTTDGTSAGTVIVKDIHTSGSATPRSLIVYNNVLHFAAYDGTDFAIWKSNGTSAGTTKVVQLAARSSGYSTSGFKLCNGTLYFLLSWNYSYSCGWGRSCTSSGSNFQQLNGATLTQVTGSTPGSFDASQSVVLNNKLYYINNYSSCSYSCFYSDHLIEISGTAGTTLLYFSRTTTNYINARPVAAGGKLYFAAGNTVSGGELWMLNSANEPVVAFERFTGTQVRSVPVSNELKKLGNRLFTTAARQPGISAHQLWQYDILATSSSVVFDIGAGGNITNLTQIDNKFYFTGTTYSKGSEPYVSDGTTAGTFLLRDIVPGFSSSLNTTSFRKAGNLVVFTAFDGTTGTELWVTNGTTTGTSLLKDVEPDYASSADIAFMQNLPNNVLLFSATTTAAGRELWRTDGTAAGTYLLKDLNAGAAYSDPQFFTNHNGFLYFTAYTATGGRELYRTDGTTAGTILLRDITPGTGDSYYYKSAASGTEILFNVQESTYGNELWKSNGTAAGTVLVKDVNPGAASGVSSIYTAKVGTNVFFLGNDGVNGTELWVTNGTSAGTVMVKDITAGATGSSISFLNHNPNNNTLYFTVQASGVQELWQSDGTGAGTYRILTLNSTTLQYISHLSFINNLLVVQAYSPSTGYELFWLRGTPDHFHVLSDINQGTASSSPTSIINQSNQLYFYANDGAGYSLFSFDNLHTLPVAFGFFTGKKAAAASVLSWEAFETTGTEIFEIERSPNGLTFEKIGTVAAGNRQSRDYRFVDAKPLKGANYYRLKTTDQNKKEMLSAILLLRFDGEATKVVLYPNPVAATAMLRRAVTQNEAATITIYDATGRTVAVKTVNLQGGINVIPLDIKTLRPGLYRLLLDAPSGNEQLSFVKQ